MMDLHWRFFRGPRRVASMHARTAYHPYMEAGGIFAQGDLRVGDLGGRARRWLQHVGIRALGLGIQAWALGYIRVGSIALLVRASYRSEINNGLESV